MSLGYPSRAARVAAFGFVALLSTPAFAACGAAPTAEVTDGLLRLKTTGDAGWFHAVVDSGSAVEGDFVYDGTNKVVAFCNGTAWVDVAAAGGSATLNGITAATANQAGIANGAYTIQWNWDTLAALQRMDRGHGELGDGSDIAAAPLINAAARMKGLSLLVNSTVRVQSEHWTRARHFRAKSARNLLVSGYDVAIQRFHTLSAY
jgi:hypothetical protein